MACELRSDLLEVNISPKGAELTSIKNKSGLEYLWTAEKEVWPRHAPVLFPIVGKLKNDKYQHEGKEFQLGQHGFARDLEFTLIEQSSSQAVFQLTANDATLQKFPFSFLLEISYILQGNQLGTHYRIVNRGKEKMPFSIGAHPGFRCPLYDNEKMEDYYLRFERSQLEITPLQNGLRKKEKQPLELRESKLPLNPALFDNDALVFEGSQINSVTLASHKNSHMVTLHSTGWPYYGVWSRKDCDRFVCLEPWFGVADDVDSTGELAKKPGIISLEPGKDFCCSFFMVFA